MKTVGPDTHKDIGWRSSVKATRGAASELDLQSGARHPYGVKVTELAAELGKSRDGVSRWYRRGTARRAEDPEFASAAEALDQAASEEP